MTNFRFIIVWVKEIFSSNYKKTPREKGRDLTQSYDKKPYTNRKLENKATTQKRH